MAVKYTKKQIKSRLGGWVGEFGVSRRFTSKTNRRLFRMAPNLEDMNEEQI